MGGSKRKGRASKSQNHREIIDRFFFFFKSLTTAVFSKILGIYLNFLYYIYFFFLDVNRRRVRHVYHIYVTVFVCVCLVFIWWWVCTVCVPPCVRARLWARYPPITHFCTFHSFSCQRSLSLFFLSILFLRFIPNFVHTLSLYLLRQPHTPRIHTIPAHSSPPTLMHCFVCVCSDQLYQ